MQAHSSEPAFAGMPGTPAGSAARAVSARRKQVEQEARSSSARQAADVGAVQARRPYSRPRGAAGGALLRARPLTARDSGHDGMQGASRPGRANRGGRPTSAGPSTPTSEVHAPAPVEEAELEELRLASFQQEFQHVLELVRLKAPQRFTHVREVLRIVDGDYDGFITRPEMQYFFRSFGIHEGVSDHFFDRLAGGSGRASYAAFVAHVGPYLELPGSEAVTNNVGRCAGIPAVRPRQRPVSRDGGEIEQRVYDKYAYWCEVESEHLKEGLMEQARREARTPSQDRVRAVQQCRRDIAQMGLRTPVSRPSSATRGRASSDSRPSSAAGGRASGARRPMGITSTSQGLLSVGQAAPSPPPPQQRRRSDPDALACGKGPAADSAVHRGGLPVARPVSRAEPE